MGVQWIQLIENNHTRVAQQNERLP